MAGAAPEGIVVDEDLRWQVLVRLAVLGQVEIAELDEALAQEPTARSRVEHTRAIASLPTSEAKEWAWRRFTGEVDASNYEVEAAGLGMWRFGQEPWTEPFVGHFLASLPTLHTVHAGWVLGTAVRAWFPTTAHDDATVAALEALLVGDLDPTVRRNLVDQVHELRCRLATISLVRGGR